MATLNITIANGFFAGTNGVYVEKSEPTHVVANGWDCTIKANGTIFCEASRKYSDGMHTARYVIQSNGFAKMTLKTPWGKPEVLKKGFVVSKGRKPTDGIIGLAGGNIDVRYGYFRDEAFQKFLDDHRISAVKHESPNQLFRVRNANYGGGKCSSYLDTDGEIIEVSYDTGRTDGWEEQFPSTCAYEGEEHLQVVNATWVVHHQVQHEGDSHNCFGILYTLEDPLKLKGVPNYTVREELLFKLQKIGRLGFKNIKELERALAEVAPVERKDDRYSFWDDTEETLYYAFITHNKSFSEAWIELRSSKSKGRGYDRFCPDFWEVDLDEYERSLLVNRK